MSVSLYLDENVPRPILLGLRLRGIDILSVQEDGYAGAPDPQVLDRAAELQRVIFTQDEDFLIEANRRQRQGIPFAGVIYAHQQNISIGSCIQDLKILAQAADSDGLANLVQYLPL